MNITITEIELKARKASEARAELHDLVGQIEDETRTLRRIYQKKLLRLIEIAATAEATLLDAVSEAPKLFEKPRSVTFHGIKCGYAKGRGELVFEDANKVIALIQKHFPEQMDTLVKVTMAPVKSALTNLPVADLRKIGVQLVETGDIAYIKPMDGEVSKLVDALLESFREAAT
jgi:arsenate reductase-like glutaredoxin family protein